MNFPEVARALALRGAEILIYPTGEPYGPHRDAWECSRRTRAYENCAYIISVNHGAYVGPVGEKDFADSPYPIFQERREGEISPVFRSHGHSEIVSYDGRVVTVVNGPGEGIAQATIDIEALRERRAEVKRNVLAQLRSALYAETYANIDAFPLDHWQHKAIQNRREGAAATKSVIDRFVAEKIYVAPQSESAG
jgi:predicted amidohydrolase